ncbi:putative membrane protein [Halalkaliarchaeum desulfuricum]|uniref:Putative membrane protein n=1 Tax=Halalkaliarchaeum desulfuricum TaxID=2055893 RepID=A0A343TMK9_9EURY|nr:DUF420 domain-containing protein [Halalkaliarchaeum desulfuricum]AUX10331.1 putative membrane protein [Halalkaliarchaeum desulfuricum]
MEVRRRARDNVPALTAILTVVALTLVFGAALQAIPTDLLPQAGDPLLDAIPTINAALSLLAIGSIAAGWRFIRTDQVEKHRAAMLASFGLFAAFLVLYLYRVALLGPAEFPGPATVETFVYLPLLGVHILLAVLCVPLLFYVLLLAATRPISEIYDTRHRIVGRVAASLWLVSFALGIVVYFLLYVVY